MKTCIIGIKYSVLCDGARDTNDLTIRVGRTLVSRGTVMVMVMVRCCSCLLLCWLCVMVVVMMVVVWW